MECGQSWQSTCFKNLERLRLSILQLLRYIWILGQPECSWKGSIVNDNEFID